MYVESYGGAGSVLLRKERSYAEVYNDLDGEIVNLFQVFRNPSQSRELIRLIRLTPYARSEFDASYITADDPIEQARRTLFRAAAGFGGGAATFTQKYKTGFRSNVVTRRSRPPAHDWGNFPQVIEDAIGRLCGVVIENEPAIKVIRRYDSPRTLHYIDPPYPFSTRTRRCAGNSYRHEMIDDDHRELAGVLRSAEGMVIISGYACDLYDDELYSGWHRETRKTHTDGAQERIEVLWINPLARQRLAAFQMRLF